MPSFLFRAEPHVTYYVTCGFLGSAGPFALPDRHQTGEQLEGALGIGHFAAAGDEGVDPLARQTQQAPEVDLLAVDLEMGPQLGAEFVPQRSFLARAQGGPAPPGTPAWFDEERLGRLSGHFLGRQPDQPGQFVGQIDHRGDEPAGRVHVTKYVTLRVGSRQEKPP